MNVYDFDGTIYNGDSTVDFYRYALRKKPGLLRFLPHQALGFARYSLKLIDKTQFKTSFFSFLRGVDGSFLVESFWDIHEKDIYGWYRKQQAEDDVIISASPAFLLQPICRRLGVRYLIASEVDPHTGTFLTPNCRGREKVSRFREQFGNTNINCFYSDSKSDLPLAVCAEKAYLVSKGTLTPWNTQDL